MYRGLLKGVIKGDTGLPGVKIMAQMGVEPHKPWMPAPSSRSSLNGVMQGIIQGLL